MALPSTDCHGELRETARVAARLKRARRVLRKAKRSQASVASLKKAKRRVAESRRRLRRQRTRSDRACGLSLEERLAPGAVKAPRSAIVSVAGDPDVGQTIVLGRGADVPAVGGFLVVDATSSSAGILGKVTSSKTSSAGTTRVHTQPATLDEAYAKFRLSYSGSLADFGASAAPLATASRISVSRVNCTGNVKIARTIDVDLSAFQVNTVLSADALYPFFSLYVVGRPTFSLQLDAGGSASCSVPLTIGPRCKPFGPVLLCFTPILKLSADGRVSLRYDWRPIFSYDLRRSGYTPSRNLDDRLFESHGTPQLEGEAHVGARLHFGVDASVGGRVGLVGSLAPHVDGTASLRTPPPAACAKVTAAIGYSLTAFADIFVKRWNWNIAKGDFLNRTLLDRCITTNAAGSTESGGVGGAGPSPSNPTTPEGGGEEPGVPKAPLPGSSKLISAGDDYTCAIRGDDTVACWGSDEFGQADPLAGTFKAVSAGFRHTCAIRGDDTVACWGGDEYGQAEPPAGTFKAVSAGFHHTCGIRSDNTVTCWGDDEYGQADPPAGTFKAISTAVYNTCGIRSDDTITCWGDDVYGQASPPSGTFKALSAAQLHTCAIRDDDTIACWGSDDYGEASPPAGTFTTVSASPNAYTCGVRSDGVILCWGYDNSAGRATPPAGTFKAVSAGNNHACAIRTDDTVTCWGSDEHGQATPPSGTF